MSSWSQDPRSIVGSPENVAAGEQDFNDKRAGMKVIEEYGHVLKDIYFRSNSPLSVPGYHTTSETATGKEIRAHGNTFGEWLEGFKRQAMCPAFPPTVGEGMTMGYGSDRYSHTVIKVTPRGKQVTLQADDHKQVGDYFGQQEWVNTPNPEGATRVARWSDKYGRYVCDGRIGSAGRYTREDPSF
jgi:hypothetical protein